MSLPGLFNLYGLKSGRIDDQAAIAVAIDTLDRTGHHGLQPKPERRPRPEPVDGAPAMGVLHGCLAVPQIRRVLPDAATPKR